MSLNRKPLCSSLQLQETSSTWGGPTKAFLITIEIGAGRLSHPSALGRERLTEHMELSPKSQPPLISCLCPHPLSQCFQVPNPELVFKYFLYKLHTALACHFGILCLAWFGLGLKLNYYVYSHHWKGVNVGFAPRSPWLQNSCSVRCPQTQGHGLPLVPISTHVILPLWPL